MIITEKTTSKSINTVFRSHITNRHFFIVKIFTSIYLKKKQENYKEKYLQTKSTNTQSHLRLSSHK